jgi:Mg2+-importing ATPase
MSKTAGVVHLPLGYWPFLAITLLAYCLLTQFCNQLFIRKFHEWL